jgi:hypothetical protein
MCQSPFAGRILLQCELYAWRYINDDVWHAVELEAFDKAEIKKTECN